MKSITAHCGGRTGKPAIDRTRCGVGDVFNCVGDYGTVDACLKAEWDHARADEAQALRLLRPLLKRARQLAEDAAGRKELRHDPDDDRGDFEPGVAFGLMVALDHFNANEDET